MESEGTRAGFVGLAGRPNVGKSTLVNAIVGQKVAIISDRPQTTRRASRGVATDVAAGWQMVLVDLPGVQRPRDVLTERMQRRVELELVESDAVLFLVNAEQGVGPGDRFIASHLLSARSGAPVICAVNKIDRLRKPALTEVLAAVGKMEVVDEVFPISAKRGTGLRTSRRPPLGALAGGAVHVSAGGPLRSAERRSSGRAGPRAGPEAHPRRGPARGRGRGPGDRGA